MQRDDDPAEPGTSGSGGRIEILHGPSAVEERLLARLAEEFAAVRQDPRLLALPVVVAVPSASLRAHLLARVVERSGAGVAGLSIVTLRGLALRVLERAGELPRRGTSLMPLLVRDLSRREPALCERLDPLLDGYRAVEASVADLLDAGLEPHHAEAIDERILELGSSGASSEIARAVVRVAAGTAEELERLGLASRSHSLARATELLADDPAHLPARAVFVHGFSDATGRACDLITALLRFHAACVLIDEPPDPSGGAPLEAFAGPLRRRLESWAEVARLGAARGTSFAPRCVAARGADAEVRSAANRIAELIAEGSSPETIGLVARDLGRYAAPVRVHLGRLGVPFSGLSRVDTGGALARRLTSLIAILRQRDRCPADRWLDGLEGLEGGGTHGEPGAADGPGRPARSASSASSARPDAVATPAAPLEPAQRADLRLGLRHLGAARLGQVSRLATQALSRSGVALPARRGLEGGEASEALVESQLESGTASRTAAPGALRRRLSGDLLTGACRAAASALDRLSAAADSQPDSFESHANQIRGLVAQDLGWPVDAPESAALFAALDALVDDASRVEVPFEDFVHLLARGLAQAGEQPLGGSGGGLQVLSVMEARARTFNHLFVLGMNRDVFPRGIREDPLLADSLRRRMAEMLPDIPIKQRGHGEERHLFAQLLASSPDVTLSWQAAADDGKLRAPSTLVERLRWALPELPVISAPAVLAPVPARAAAAAAGRAPGLDPDFKPGFEPGFEPAGLAAPAPAYEHALRAALLGERDALAGPLALAFADQAAGEVDSAALAAARLAVVREYDSPPSRGPMLGPYMGFVGRVVDASDPRRAKPYVTALEQLARCPWKSFLERTLRVESVPDPIESLPEVDALMLGSVVHRVLERLAREALPETSDAPHTAPGGGPVGPSGPSGPIGRTGLTGLTGPTDSTGRADARGSAGAVAPLASVGADELSQVVAADAVPLAWPGDSTVFGLLREEAVRLLAESGVALRGLVDVLVALAWPRLERARDLEWPTPEATISLAGVEVEGSVRLSPLDPASQPSDDDALYFRADRVDRVEGTSGGEARVFLTDYKTGRPPSTAAKPDTRHKHFELLVRGGTQLQAVAYALAAPGQGAVGRYLYLDPDADLDKLEYLAPAQDAALRASFERAVRALLAVRREGSFAPRLVDSKTGSEPTLCSHCDVAEACLRGDSSARRRLADWIESGESAADASATPRRADLSSPEGALRSLYDLALEPAPGEGTA